jgi:hypothetical protein
MICLKPPPPPPLQQLAHAAALEPLDETVLWRCHPALAQPGGSQYVYLELLPEVTSSRSRKRTLVSCDEIDGAAEADQDVLTTTTSNRARRLTGHLEMDAATSSRATSSRFPCLPPDARDGSVRILTGEEEVVVKEVLRPHLGPHVELDQVLRYQTHTTGEAVVRGLCAAQTAWCVAKTKLLPQAQGTTTSGPYTHSRNRMRFSLRAGVVQVHCFACDQGTSGHRFPWHMTSGAQHQLMGVVAMADAGSSSAASAASSSSSSAASSSSSSSSAAPDASSSSSSSSASSSSVGDSHGKTVQFLRAAMHTLSHRVRQVALCYPSPSSAARARTSLRKRVATASVSLSSSVPPPERPEIKLFREIVLQCPTPVSNTTPLLLYSTPEAMFDRLRHFQQKCENLRRAPQWAKVVTLHERYLDPTNTSTTSTQGGGVQHVEHLLQLFMDCPHLAIQSGLGTNKTGLVLLMLFLFLLLDPSLRVLVLSNRITFANTLRERAKEFDNTIAAAYGGGGGSEGGGPRLGLRSYTESQFKRHGPPRGRRRNDNNNQERTKGTKGTSNEVAEWKRRNATADRLLVSTPRLIISPQSLSRLFVAKTESGEPIVPQYDVVIGDEFMELLHIFATATMNEKRLFSQ